MSPFPKVAHARRGARALLLAALLAGALTPARARAQQVLSQPEQVITIAQGTSALIDYPSELVRVSVTNPGIAEAVVISPTEVLINGIGLGTTSLFVWDTPVGAPRLYSVEVTADIASLQRYLALLFPGEDLQVTAQGGTVILSGRVSDAFIARRANELATATGAQVLDNLQTPAARQILLEVRIAEVSRDMLYRLGSNLLHLLNPEDLSVDGDVELNTASGDGIVDFSLISNGAELDILIRALKSVGAFKSLAEPNLLALDGETASFLAGGEFPYPTVQGGSSSNAVTLEWREFGVRLAFTPTVTNIGNIRLAIAPEVSTLDFAGGLTVNGFQVPTILSRRAATEVELREGQHLAIAGLLDNRMQESMSKIPLLGDIPILGNLFRNKDERQERSELLVIVTPRVVTPQDDPIPLPTGEPETWDWDGNLLKPPFQPDTAAAGGR
jgi:pilus assembly protein CpaC